MEAVAKSCTSDLSLLQIKIASFVTQALVSDTLLFVLMMTGTLIETGQRFLLSELHRKNKTEPEAKDGSDTEGDDEENEDDAGEQEDDAGDEDFSDEEVEEDDVVGDPDENPEANGDQDDDDDDDDDDDNGDDDDDEEEEDEEEEDEDEVEEPPAKKRK